MPGGVAVTGVTAVAGLVGGPEQVAGSLSPRIHNAAFAAAGLDWVYVGFPVAEADGEPALRGLMAAGVRGLNVTMPHKLAAARAAGRLEGLAAAVGAANTLARRGSEIVGWNTDGEGLVRFVSEDAGAEVEGATVLVLGAGGSGRSSVAALAGAGAGAIAVAARNPARAEALRVLAGPVPFEAHGWEAAGAAVGRADLVVNCTPVGQEGEAPPVPLEALRPSTVVVDLVYRPRTTRLVEEARARGAGGFGGLGMLVRQAAASFEIWTGVPAPLEAMRAAAGLPPKGA